VAERITLFSRETDRVSSRDASRVRRSTTTATTAKTATSSRDARFNKAATGTSTTKGSRTTRPILSRVISNTQAHVSSTDVSAVPFEIVAEDRFPIGGRLRHFLPFWRRVTNSRSVLQTVMGVNIPFTNPPVQSAPSPQYVFNAQDKAEVRRELKWMLDQKIIVPVQPRPDQYVSPLFLATNADKTKRPILNVKTINEEYLPKLHFKMETLAAVLPLFERGDWFTSWDLRKGFFNIYICPADQKYFCFEFEGVRYQFTCLVMGLSISPLYFSKLVGVLVLLARRWGIRVSFYMDDTLLRAPTFSEAYENHQLFGNLFQQAGFLLHRDKSVSEPTQCIKYLGFVIDSTTLTISLPPEKVARLKQAVKKALREIHSQRVSSIRIAAKTIGFILSSLPATTYGKAHYRNLEEAKLHALQIRGTTLTLPSRGKKVRKKT
jgi:hypothetical protein